MYSIAFEFETEEEMEKIAETLWNKHGITGEFEMYSTPEGKFRLQVFAEKKIKEGVLAKIPGAQIKTKGNYGSSAPKEGSSDD